MHGACMHSLIYAKNEKKPHLKEHGKQETGTLTSKQNRKQNKGLLTCQKTNCILLYTIIYIFFVVFLSMEKCQMKKR